MRKLLLVSILLFVSLSIVGCGGTMTTTLSTAPKVPAPPIHKKIGEVTLSEKAGVESLFTKEKLSSKDKALMANLTKMNIIALKDNVYTINDLDKVANNNKFDSITHTHDGLIALTKRVKNKKTTISFILYFTKEYQFVKIAQFNKYVSKLTLSDDGKMAFAWRKRNVIDLTNYKIIQTFGKLEFYDVKSKMYFRDRTIENLKFSPKNTYLTYVVRYDGTKEDHSSSILKRISDKKQFYGNRFVRIPDSYPHNVYSNISDNEKYIINDSFGAVDNWEHTAGAFPIYEIPSKKHLKILNMPEKHGMPRPYATWNSNMLFYFYYTFNDIQKDFKGNAGLYDIENDQFFCENMAKPMNNIAIRKLIWNAQTDNLYLINDEKVYPFILKDNKCYPMPSYTHNIGALANSKYENTMINDNSTLYVYSQDKRHTELINVKLRKYSQKDLDRLNAIKKAERLLNSGFEDRGLKQLKTLIDGNGIPEFNTTKYKWAYRTYLRTIIFNRELTRTNKMSYDLVFNYKQILKYLSWYGYENLLPQFNKAYREALKTKEIIYGNTKEYLSLGEVIYLLSINKDAEAYEKLFSMQPLDQRTKSQITNLTFCKSSFTQNLDKLAVAADIPRENFKTPIDCHSDDNGKHPFFFDINGKKVFKNEKPKKVIPKKEVIKSEKDDAIELLD